MSADILIVDDEADIRMLLSGILEDNKIDLVFASGAEMKPMFDALPKKMRGAHSDDAEAIGTLLAGKLHADDAVMIKGSLASNMGAVVKALLDEFKPANETTNGKEPLHAV